MIDDSLWWIDGNFKETQIRRIKPKQKVNIQLDMYSHQYQGYVDSISYASGSTFSLLPAQNSSGNWVKVAQRFTVRIVLRDNKAYPLRVGASSTVTVNTIS
jgi:membrane fusion protein (multidrug efflux system)